MDIEQMLKELADLRYMEPGYNGNPYEASVIKAKHMDKVENVIRKYMSRNPYIEQVNMLSAKIYVYEQIIAKSNFAPMLKDGNEWDPKWIPMLEEHPKHGKEVIITCEDVQSFERYTTIGAFDSEHGEFELDSEHQIPAICVRAWMPLPKPYKEDKHG